MSEEVDVEKLTAQATASLLQAQLILEQDVNWQDRAFNIFYRFVHHLLFDTGEIMVGASGSNNIPPGALRKVVEKSLEETQPNVEKELRNDTVKKQICAALKSLSSDTFEIELIQTFAAKR